MAEPMNIFEQFQIVSAIVPVDLETGANNGDWVNLAQYDAVDVILFTAAGAGSDFLTLSFNQAKDVAGTGSKALGNVLTKYYLKQGTLTSVGTFTKTTQTAAGSVTLTAVTSAVVGVHIKAEMLDQANGFSCVQLAIADPGSAGAYLGCALYVMTGPRFIQEPMPSAIV